MATTTSLSSSNAPEHMQRHLNLLNASLLGKEATVREILAEEKWPSTSDLDTLRQSLVKAATKGNLEIVRLLLESGAEVHPQREGEVAPLFKAAEAGHEDVVVELLQHRRTDPNWRQWWKNGHTALFRAAECGHVRVVELLLQSGADANLRARNGQTALHLACQRGHVAIARALLLEGGADPDGGRDSSTGRAGDKDGRTPLLFMASEKSTKWRVEKSKEQAEKDGDQAEKDGEPAEEGREPAAKKGREPATKKGREPATKKGREPTAKKSRDTAEKGRESAEKGGDPAEIVKLLLERGADPNAKDSINRTTLHWAATNNLMELGRCLLNPSYGRKIELDAAQNRGKTALHLASEHNQEEFVKLLLGAGASVDARSDGRWTPLINAAEKGHATVVSKLLAAGADVNAELSNHMTALHWASFNGHEEVVRLLLERPEAKLARKDQFERTPLICAAERYHSNIVSMLSPARHAHRLSESAREATKQFEATIVDFGQFQENKWKKNEVSEKKPQLVFKHTVFDLLYGWDEKTDKPTVPVLTRNIKWEPQFRWIHLPANNIAWIETLLAKSFIEGGHRDIEGFKALGKCFDQEHRGPLAHANFMRTYCHRVPSSRTDREDSSLSSLPEQTAIYHSSQPTQAGAESNPTDHSENSNGRPEGSKRKGKSEQIAERHPHRGKRNKGHPGNPPGKKESKLSTRQSSFASSEIFKQLVNNGKMVVFMPFLHYETHDRRMSMTTTVEKARKGGKPGPNASRDELLVHAYWKRHLHLRRTLDQFFYHGIDTTQRDSDQVVWRYCDKYRRPDPPKLFMVDQLWMWILGGDTVITCFPQRWDQPKQDPLNVVDGIIEETSAKSRPRIQSVYDLAMVITNRCAGMFDRHRIDDQQFQFLDMFESSIGNVTDQEGKLFSKFKAASEEATKWLHRNRGGSAGELEHDFSDDLLNIHQETKLLVEIKDIQDELNILMGILNSQMNVLGVFQKNIEDELLQPEVNRKVMDPLIKDIRRHFNEQSRLITVHHDDIFRMNEQSKEIYLSLTNLLDLKQKHSNALEARFAREQAHNAAKQGQTIMVFTIVTIIFLPMSFIASFFAINFKEWGDDLTISYASRYMFPIGLAISFLFVMAAFMVEDISGAWKHALRSTTNYLKDLTGRGSRSSNSSSSSSGGGGGGQSETDRETAVDSWSPTKSAVRASISAYRSMAEDLDWKQRGLDGAGSMPVHHHNHHNNISFSRNNYDGPHGAGRLGMSPIRYGRRDLSIGSGGPGGGVVRSSFDGRRRMYSEDLERGRDQVRLYT